MKKNKTFVFKIRLVLPANEIKGYKETRKKLEQVIESGALISLRSFFGYEFKSIKEK